MAGARRSNRRTSRSRRPCVTTDAVSRRDPKGGFSKRGVWKVVFLFLADRGSSAAAVAGRGPLVPTAAPLQPRRAETYMKVPLKIHWTIPVTIHWTSDNALENATDK